MAAHESPPEPAVPAHDVGTEVPAAASTPVAVVEAPDPALITPTPAGNASDGGSPASSSSSSAAATDHTSLPPELWLEIFRHATHVPRSRTIAPPDPFAPERPANYAWGVNAPIQSMHTKCALVRVCRAWRALATELLYEHAALGSPRRVQLFCRALLESEAADRKAAAAVETSRGELLGHGRWVRHLEIQRWARSAQSLQYWQNMVRCVILCPKLRVFSGLWQTPLPQGLLAALEQYLPSTLQELYWQQDSVLIAAKELPILTTSFLSKFSSLRVLDLRKICILDAERSLQDVNFVALTLPHVAYLALPTCPLLLRFASRQEMPALHYLILDAAGAPRTVWAPWVAKELSCFLERHGSKLTTVELLPAATLSFRPGPIGISAFLSPTACPNLDTLVFDCREKAICPSSVALAHVSDRDAHALAAGVAAQSALNATGPAAPLLEGAHPRLRRVGLRGTAIGRLYPNKPTQAQAHLHALAGCRAFLPALELVRTLGFLVGTSTDAFAPDVFIWWTEKFERVGVDLQDGEGVAWMLEEEEEKLPGNTTKAADKIKVGADGPGEKVEKADTGQRGEPAESPAYRIVTAWGYEQ